jgi:superfamily II DNA or RNA helicase
MTENITKIETRNQLIVNFIDILKSMGRKILILSYRVEHLEKLKNMIDTKIKEDMETHIYNSYFYMGKTKRTEKDMAEKDGDIIFATMQLAEEGLDISHLDTVIFALPVPIQKDKKSGKIKSSKTLIQSIGRILRNDTLEHLTQIPLVIDISDMFSIYSGWSDKRDEIYTKKNWFMQNYYWNDSDYQYKTSNNLKISENSETILKEDKNINPMNIVLDDISDEEFIEKNLILKDDVSHSITDITSDSEDDNSNIKSKPSYGFGKIKR